MWQEIIVGLYYRGCVTIHWNTFLEEHDRRKERRRVLLVRLFELFGNHSRRRAVSS